MDRWERDGLRATNSGMRNQVDHILDALAEQRTHLKEVHEKLSALRCTAESADKLVEVTVDAAGVIVDVRFTPDALRSTPEQLGRSVTEAGREAARRAREQHTAIIAPLTADAEAIPDLPDLVPGAPSLREVWELPRPDAAG
ncbi:YbaB/EbfC family nucleoid-associated protein [Nocardia abscessus]|uniref:YbaB/EbfC family nucleoid-associated protein n=1 Tax=Nocardia TaxID=1817 RepID=UPI00189631B0|nr:MULTISPECIES: YbaB/EbfC family nucleoid-associated protein [Nocardia]MBF6217790.1 YbaB/EbfC family nucleoid-associated protein [Nocardia abscessus]MDE1674584.1 YbaB/EbfC family nucleoid-associated protein [Nocardia gipuzkoensis]